jgi:hypothetical protein
LWASSRTLPHRAVLENGETDDTMTHATTRSGRSQRAGTRTMRGGWSDVT